MLRRKHEFLQEVYNFLVIKKQGLETTHFLIEELKAYLLSQDSTFPQVFIVINISLYIFAQDEVTNWIELTENLMHDDKGNVYILM